jgi:hypothetical protein
MFIGSADAGDDKNAADRTIARQINEIIRL